LDFRPFSDPDHPLTPKGAIGWSGSVQGLKQQGGTRADERWVILEQMARWGDENQWFEI